LRVLRYYPRAIDGDGGITASVWSSAEAMQGMGAEVTVAYDGDPEGDPTRANGPVRLVPVAHRGPKRARVPVGLEPLLAAADVLVLHSAWTAHNLAAARAARRVGVPYVLEPRGAYDPHIVRRHRAVKAAWWRLGEAEMVRHSAAVHMFFPSESSHLERLGYHGPRITVPNGVRVPPRYAWDGGSGGYLLWLGRFDPEHKGLDILLRALARLPKDDRPMVRLHGPEWRGRKRIVTELVSQLGLDAGVHVGGPLYGEAKFAAMCAARAFVYPSRWEAFGNAVAEAAAVGTPVLTTRYPLGEYLEEREAGIACRAEEESLAEGVRSVLADDSARLGARARHIARHEFQWDATARRWLDQVGELL
jgi:glycosyltransferase involved in cell wall biosynthesis